MFLFEPRVNLDPTWLTVRPDGYIFRRVNFPDM